MMVERGGGCEWCGWRREDAAGGRGGEGVWGVVEVWGSVASGK